MELCHCAAIHAARRTEGEVAKGDADVGNRSIRQTVRTPDGPNRTALCVRAGLVIDFVAFAISPQR
jgi:hypothetical protein